MTIPEVDSADDVIRILNRSWPNASLKDFDGIDVIKWYYWAVATERLQFSSLGRPFVGSHYVSA